MTPAQVAPSGVSLLLKSSGHLAMRAVSHTMLMVFAQSIMGTAITVYPAPSQRRNP